MEFTYQYVCLRDRSGASAAIRFGDEIEIIVQAVTGNQVRIGIDAPQAVPMHCEEIYQRIAEERETA